MQKPAILFIMDSQLLKSLCFLLEDNTGKSLK